MIPLRSENPVNRFPWMTATLIALNTAIFAYECTLDTACLQALWTKWAFIPARFLANPLSPSQVATMFTAMFMHAGWIHAGGNLLYLWIFGNNIEAALGSRRFLLFYLTCGITAALTQAFVAPESTVPTLGASGAIAGVLGAYILLYPKTSVLTLIPVFFFAEIARVPSYLIIGFWFVLQLASGIAALGAGTLASGGVAWFAHLGGFLTGMLFALPLLAATRRRYRR